MRALTLSLVSALSILVAGACTSETVAKPGATHPGATAAPALDLRGRFHFGADGDLRLALDERCTTARHLASRQLGDETVDCTRARLDAIQVIAATPWGARVRGTWIDAGTLSFRPPWDLTGIDPLADDAIAQTSRPWTIGDVGWRPSADDAARMVALIGDATDTQTDLQRGGPPPSLEVAALEVSGGALQAGAPGKVTVRVANHGAGPAYRVVVTTRSSVTSLHGRRLAFGLIKPGAEKVRTLDVTVPVTENAPDTMLVLVFAEGNGFTPHNVSRRISIRPVASVPILAVQCAVAGHDAGRLELDAGEDVELHCTVDNSAEIAARVELATSVAGAVPGVTGTKDIAARGHATFDVTLTVPRDLALDSAVEIAVTARDRRFLRTASTMLAGVVRKPKLCSAGQLTRAQYNAKMAELRAAAASGDLTQAELDRYDAELVGCLQ